MLLLSVGWKGGVVQQHVVENGGCVVRLGGYQQLQYRIPCCFSIIWVTMVKEHHEPICDWLTWLYRANSAEGCWDQPAMFGDCCPVPVLSGPASPLRPVF